MKVKPISVGTVVAMWRYPVKSMQGFDHKEVISSCPKLNILLNS